MQVRAGGISIWFFIGISLLVNGALILGAGIYHLVSPPANPPVLFHLHAAVWWGAMLFALGLLYTLRFSPRRLRRTADSTRES
jgi:FtsH-binding integral membrane protein